MTNNFFKALVFFIATSSFLLFSLQNCTATAENQILLEKKSLAQFLQKWGIRSGTSYKVVLQDLNGDGVPEAIVYVMGAWCGSGGCTTLILTQSENSWKILSKITLTNLPIKILDTTSHGWHSLSVWVHRGSLKSGYEAELKFDGKNYPSNPTLAPATRASVASFGKIILSNP